MLQAGSRAGTTYGVLPSTVRSDSLTVKGPVHLRRPLNAQGMDKIARLGEKKVPIRLLLAAVGGLKFGFCALLLFGLLFESLAITLATSSGFLVNKFFVLLL